MAKKDKKKNKNLDKKVIETGLTSQVLSKRGWKIVGIGVGVVTLGFIVLTMTDPRGQNFASAISPFLIIGGYTTIGLGIISKDPS